MAQRKSSSRLTRRLPVSTIIAAAWFPDAALDIDRQTWAALVAQEYISESYDDARARAERFAADAEAASAAWNANRAGRERERRRFHNLADDDVPADPFDPAVYGFRIADPDELPVNLT